MQFCLGVIPKTATGCHPNSIEFFLMHFCHKSINFSLNITLEPPNMASWDSDLSNDMYFVKIIKSFDSKRP